MTNCPTSAYTKRDDGVVVHEIDVCVGCKLCTVACPYGSPTYNELSGKVYKCQMCYQRLDESMLPSCVEGCPVGALGLLDLETSAAVTSVGEFKVTDAVTDVDELPSSRITNPEHRFIKRKHAQQVSYQDNS